MKTEDWKGKIQVLGINCIVPKCAVVRVVIHSMSIMLLFGELSFLCHVCTLLLCTSINCIVLGMTGQSAGYLWGVVVGQKWCREGLVLYKWVDRCDCCLDMLLPIK